jgi:hypothetical protein
VVGNLGTKPHRHTDKQLHNQFDSLGKQLHNQFDRLLHNQFGSLGMLRSMGFGSLGKQFDTLPGMRCNNCNKLDTSNRLGKKPHKQSGMIFRIRFGSLGKIVGMRFGM